jgi:hypothetical protein
MRLPKQQVAGQQELFTREAHPRPKTTILALDPGGVTGYRCQSLIEGRIASAPIVGQFNTDAHHAALYNLVRTVHATKPEVVVVCEGYGHRWTAQIPVALEYIGVVKAACQALGIHYTERPPSRVKTFWTNDKLKALGFWEIGQPHARDATRHWLSYACELDRTFEQHLVRRLADRTEETTNV